MGKGGVGWGGGHSSDPSSGGGGVHSPGIRKAGDANRIYGAGALWALRGVHLFDAPANSGKTKLV